MKKYSNGLAMIAVGVAAFWSTLANAEMAKPLNELLPEKIRSAGTLTGAASLGVPPLLYTDDDNVTAIGAVAEIIRAYSDRLGVEFEFNQVKGGGSIPGVISGRYDVVASVGDFKSRQEVLDFVDLVKGGTALVVQQGNPEGIAGLDDLCGRKVATSKGSIQESQVPELSSDCESQGKEPLEMMSFPDSSAAVLALQSSRSDVFWDDLASAGYRIKNSDGAFEFAGAPQDLAPYAVGIPKENVELRDAIFEAMKSIFEDGTYHAILKEWGLSALALEKIEINGSKF